MRVCGSSLPVGSSSAAAPKPIKTERSTQFGDLIQIQVSDPAKDIRRCGTVGVRGKR